MQTDTLFPNSQINFWDCFRYPNYKTLDVFSHYTHSDNESLPLLPPTELLLLLTLQEMLTGFSPPDSYVNAHIN